MSHIPSAAMPHAKPHEHEPEPTIAPPIRQAPLPWAALAAGGVLAIGGAVTAAWLLRGRRTAPSERSSTRRPTRKKAGSGSTRAKPANGKSRTGGRRGGSEREG